MLKIDVADKSRRARFQCARFLCKQARWKRIPSRFRTFVGNVKIPCICPKRSKPILDEIDTVLAGHYGFTAEELDFILKYDIKYRLGRATEGEEEDLAMPAKKKSNITTRAMPPAPSVR